MNYTKGPWKTTEINYYIHNVWTDEPHRSAQVGECRGIDRAANARLISAAPDMYEELKRLIEISGWDETHPAVKAIAKAEGK